jgi:hypothetical protein
LSRAAAAVCRFAPKYLYALAASFFLFTAGVSSRKHRFLIFQIAKHFGMKMPAGDERIPAVPLSTVLGRHLDLTLLEPLGTAGNVTLLELLVIASLARCANPPVAFEIGTFDGRTALNIAANLSQEGKVYTLDLPKSDIGRTRFTLALGERKFADKESSGAKFAGTEFASKIEQLYGDSATFDFTPYEHRSGLVFVDGSHAFEYVLQDTATALRLASVEKAFILWHDYQPDWPDVIRALNRAYETNPWLGGLQRIEGTSLVLLKREDSRCST